MMQPIPLLLDFIQEKLYSCSSRVQIPLAVCWTFAVVRPPVTISSGNVSVIIIGHPLNTHILTQSTIPHIHTLGQPLHTHIHTVNHSTHTYHPVNHSTYTWSTIPHITIHTVNHSTHTPTHTHKHIKNDQKQIIIYST